MGGGLTGVGRDVKYRLTALSNPVPSTTVIVWRKSKKKEKKNALGLVACKPKKGKSNSMES